jgi:hypothetical protein
MPLAAITAFGVLVPPVDSDAPDDPAPRVGASGAVEHPNHEHAHEKTHQRRTIEELRTRVARPPGLR